VYGRRRVGRRRMVYREINQIFTKRYPHSIGKGEKKLGSKNSRMQKIWLNTSSMKAIPPEKANG
jgi:hypothetical protein